MTKFQVSMVYVGPSGFADAIKLVNARSQDLAISKAKKLVEMELKTNHVIFFRVDCLAI